MKPKFKHDCKDCKYLGTVSLPDASYDTADKGDYDLYFCPQSGIPTIVARYGNDGPNYLSDSGMNSVMLLLKIGRMIAKNREFIRYEF